MLSFFVRYITPFMPSSSGALGATLELRLTLASTISRGAMDAIDFAVEKHQEFKF